MAGVCLTAIAVLAGGASARAASTARVRPQVKRSSLLYVANAAAGSLQRRHGHLVLTLTGLDRHVTWFSDRPARQTGAFPGRGLVAAWPGFGFATAPPNAALVYTDPTSHLTRTAILVLRHPRTVAHGAALAFAVSVINPRHVRGDLATHAQTADTRPATTLRDPSLFIDDTTAPVVDGCVLQAETECSNATLNNVDLAGLDLTGADFSDVYLSNADFAGANLQNATFNQTDGSSIDFSNANLSEAVFAESDYTSPNFSGANVLITIFTLDQITNPSLNGVQNLSVIEGCSWPGLPFAGLPTCG